MTQVFINLPVKDLAKSKDFFANLGYEFDTNMTDDSAACMIIRKDIIYAMLLTHGKFKEFSPNPIAEKATETLTCLSCESKEKVNEFVDKAVSLGATTFKEPMDYGFMYARSFQDLDGHIWEIMWMTSEPMPEGATMPEPVVGDKRKTDEAPTGSESPSKK